MRAWRNGRRAGFRSRSREGWRFESSRPHWKRARLRSDRCGSRRLWRGVAVIAWLLGLAAWIDIRFAPYGFNPTDDGYILSQARRILHGSIPHVGLISPRPLGSSFLHIIDWLLPLPIYDAARLVATVEMTVVACLFAWFVFNRPPWRWSILEAIGAGTSVLLNIHVFPLMTWHTVDGLLCLAAGLVLTDYSLRSGKRGTLVAAFVLLGLAPLMKQGFIAAPILGAAWLIWSRRNSGPRRLASEVGIAVGAAATPAVLYTGLVAAGGGIGDMVAQLTTAGGLMAWPPLDIFVTSQPARRMLFRNLIEIGLAIMVIRVCTVVANRLAGRSPLGAAAVRLAALVAALAALVVVLHIVFGENLMYGGAWGSKLMWVLGLVAIVDSLLQRSLDGRAMTVFAAAVMSTVSWGYAVPNLLAGTLALVVVDRLLRSTLLLVMTRRPFVVLPAAIGAICLFAVTASSLATARRGFVYFDRPQAELTVSLRGIAADFGRLRSTPTTARYIRDLRDCIDEHPASRVAILPDNPGIYAVFDLNNPFAIDWMFNLEIVGAENRLVSAARRLDQHGDYLVLFQTFSAFDLQSHARDPDATTQTAPFFGSATVEAIYRQLHGTKVACGLFVGYYAKG